MRKAYIDNLRTTAILLLFPYHVFMIYNNWGERFYINGRALLLPSLFVGASAIWMMPLLFALAGISAAYALQKRNARDFVRERTAKLLLPLVFGLLLIIPIQSYLASLCHGIDGANYLRFFSYFGDLTGTDGGFTPGQLWFILYLFVISLAFLPLLVLYNKKCKAAWAGKIPLVALVAGGVIPVLTHPLLNIGGKSLCEFASYFLLGYYILSDEAVQEKLEKQRFLLLGISLLADGISVFLGNMFFEFASWLSILAIIGLARRYFNGNSRAYTGLTKLSFGLYVFHQSWIVVCAFFIFKLTDAPLLQIPLILSSAVILTFASVLLCQRFSPLRRMFGIGKLDRKNPAISE